MTKNTSPKEEYEARVFAEWLELMKMQGKVVKFAHIANESYGGTRSDMLRGAKLKLMGKRPGVWDYEIYVPALKCEDSLLCIKIELKRQKGGKLSPEQKEWEDVYHRAGHITAVCNGADEAIAFVEKCF